MDYSAFHWSEKARKYAETVGTIFNVKGRVNTVQDLPSTGNKVGDLWLVGLTTDPDLIEYAWLSFDNVTRWEKLGSTATSLSFSTITGSPNDNVALKNALDGKYSTSNPDGYISGITSAMVTTALGYTPYNSSNPAGYTSNVGTVTSVNNTSPDGNGNVTITIPDPLPSQTGQNGKYLTTNGTSASWGSVDALPSQTGNTGKFLTTNGTSASWGVPKTHDLFDHKWEDYLLNDQSWLRADTFSWQDGTVYFNAYNHLVADYNNPEPTETLTYNNLVWFRDSSKDDTAAYFYAWVNQSETVFTTEVNPTISSILYSYDEEDGYLNMGAVIESVSLQPAPRTETIGSYTITYWLATDGHKIVMPDQETTVQNIYNESGVAWYYILDTTNQRFKLPRENPAREELIQTVRAKGNGVTLGLTNGTNNVGVGMGYTPSSYSILSVQKAQYGTSVGSASSVDTDLGNKTYGITTDSTKSGIISSMTDSTSVYKGKQYLYFYVGQFSQSATEQTAGLNSELFNGKADIEALNNKIQLVSTPPVTQTNGVLYVIPE